ncbi:MAG TPA: ribonuclease H-like domain-containing protein [Candidatus Methanoperedens sp.]
MLTNTYIHIPAIGPKTERSIWENGIVSWNDFLRCHHLVKVSRAKRRLLLSGVEDSIEQLARGNHIYFAKSLRSRDQWRAYRHFRKNSAFVDIETTGLCADFDRITLIGIFDGKDIRTYIRGINLEEALTELAKYKQLVTFNGARFDLPFIEHEFPGFFNHLHVDLLYPLKWIGYSGGLKRIEHMLGISRSDETEGISGFDAVRLWNLYEHGDEEALDLLIKYNNEDVMNLEKIIEMTYPMLVKNEIEGKVR